MKRCKLFILCCLVLIAAVGNGNAEEPRLKTQRMANQRCAGGVG